MSKKEVLRDTAVITVERWIPKSPRAVALADFICEVQTEEGDGHLIASALHEARVGSIKASRTAVIIWEHQGRLYEWRIPRKTNLMQFLGELDALSRPWQICFVA
jgi:hypothetical protein